jgi:hypothetical protein
MPAGTSVIKLPSVLPINGEVFVVPDEVIALENELV